MSRRRVDVSGRRWTVLDRVLERLLAVLRRPAPRFLVLLRVKTSAACK